MEIEIQTLYNLCKVFSEVKHDPKSIHTITLLYSVRPKKDETEFM